VRQTGILLFLLPCLALPSRAASGGIPWGSDPAAVKELRGACPSFGSASEDFWDYLADVHRMTRERWEAKPRDRQVEAVRAACDAAHTASVTFASASEGVGDAIKAGGAPQQKLAMLAEADAKIKKGIDSLNQGQAKRSRLVKELESMRTKIAQERSEYSAAKAAKRMEGSRQTGSVHSIERAGSAADAHAVFEGDTRRAEEPAQPRQTRTLSLSAVKEQEPTGGTLRPVGTKFDSVKSERSVPDGVHISPVSESGWHSFQESFRKALNWGSPDKKKEEQPAEAVKEKEKDGEWSQNFSDFVKKQKKENQGK
jgi:hypothetical protein